MTSETSKRFDTRHSLLLQRVDNKLPPQHWFRLLWTGVLANYPIGTVFKIKARENWKEGPVVLLESVMQRDEGRDPIPFPVEWITTEHFQVVERDGDGGFTLVLAAFWPVLDELAEDTIDVSLGEAPQLYAIIPNGNEGHILLGQGTGPPTLCQILTTRATVLYYEDEYIAVKIQAIPEAITLAFADWPETWDGGYDQPADDPQGGRELVIAVSAQLYRDTLAGSDAEASVTAVFTGARWIAPYPITPPTDVPPTE